jgi:hypothetical protein
MAAAEDEPNTVKNKFAEMFMAIPAVMIFDPE